MSAQPRMTHRIDICHDADVAYWTDTLGITEEQLRRTIAEVGDTVDAVCECHPQGVSAALA